MEGRGFSTKIGGLWRGSGVEGLPRSITTSGQPCMGRGDYFQPDVVLLTAYQ